MREIHSSKRTLVWLSEALLCIALCAAVVQAQTARNRSAGITPEQKTAQFFESIRTSPPQQWAFLLKMPKGGDLHNHLSGAIYAESFIRWAAENKLCVNTTTLVLSQLPCDPAAGQTYAEAALSSPVFYRQLIDAWSMRYWQFSGQNGHDRFFDTFGKFGAATDGQTGQMLAEAMRRAARGHVIYLELMLTPDGGMSSNIGRAVGWNDDFAGTLDKLKTQKPNSVEDAARAAIEALQSAETKKDAILKCGTPQAEAGCAVTVRYIFQVSRGAALGPVFAQMVTAFILANDPNSKVVALNLVQPEDSLASMGNFSLHMRMLNFLRPLYPRAHIALHAGELAPGIVPPEGLSFHIRESIQIGHAERIGHGVDIMHEDEPYELLREMVERNVMLEVCLTSNDVILGVSGKQHPLAVYLQYGVPAALATDDEGVSRSEISREYLRAAEDQGLGYLELKTMARTSLQHAFLPGQSLWRDAKKFVPVAQCAKDIPGPNAISLGCQQYLASSEKARLQWKLEEELRLFESRF